MLDFVTREMLKMNHDVSKIQRKDEKSLLDEIKIRKNAEPEFLSDLTSLPTCLLQWFEEINNDLITVWDKYGNIKFLSKSVVKVLGYQPADLANQEWRKYVSAEDIDYIYKHFDTNSLHNQSFTINILNKEGKNLITKCVIKKIKDDTMKDPYFIAVINDITAKKISEEMMIRSEKMNVAGQLAAGIAHEIRNPLTSLKGFLQLLQAGVNHKEEYYKIMVDEIEKMEKITSELLFISKPLSGHIKAEYTQEMIDDVLALLHSQAKMKHIQLERKSKGKIFIECDKSQIKQVLINIVKNAIESMNEPGIISIHVYMQNEKAVIDIMDEGPGIPEEIIHKLGEPFFTTKKNGTGLGLMITKQILERHGATLEILKNKEKGSTFKLVFPLSEKNMH